MQKQDPDQGERLLMVMVGFAFRNCLGLGWRGGSVLRFRVCVESAVASVEVKWLTWAGAVGGGTKED